MTQNTIDKKFINTDRPRIALMTNHGYAGVDIPFGGAPDTGGQNMYVNALARALDEAGHQVTIFARGGFPFFKSEKMRIEREYLTDHARYIYIPGGGNEFIRKEDIAVALDEETSWLTRFICDEAREAGVSPWRYFECINTHYWDAAVIAVKLVERWQDQAAYEFLTKVNNGVFANSLESFAGNERHRTSLSREIDLHLGLLAQQTLGTSDPDVILNKLLGSSESLEPKIEIDPINQPLEIALRTGRALASGLTHDGSDLADIFFSVDKHVWTPHSLGIVKERNFWNKPEETIRNLKFRERNSHEEFACARTSYFCSTSPEIWRSLVAYHSVMTNSVFDFPPCIDGKSFKPRSKPELSAVYSYLSEKSGIDAETLMNSKIIFETSRMDKTKRKDLLLTAFAQVAQKVDNTYMFIGGGPASSPLFKELEELKGSIPSLEGRGFLLGFIPDEVLEPLFSAADIFVSASEMEGFGMSASQAAAAGVAVISSDLIPFATQYAPDATIVVKAGDTDGFALAMIDLLNNDEKRQQKADEVRAIAEQMDWVATAKRFISWFHDRNH